MVLAVFMDRSLAADSLVLSQAKLGNVFLISEIVQIPLQTTGTSVTWTVKDFFGTEVAGATISVPGNGQAVIAPGLGRLGFFEVHATAFRAGNQVAVADTTFAVVAPSNVGAMRDSPFGVMTHFAQGWTMDIMQILARGGIVQFRDEQYWQNVEPTRTVPAATYTFANYQGYMATASGLGLNPLMVLDFENTNYDGGDSPYTEDGRTGYANYCTALLQRYGAQIDTVAIWNEYNGSFSKGQAITNRAFYYTEMLKKAYSAIKLVRPDVRVIGGACVPVPLPWYQDLFALGAHDYLDIIDAHPYRAIPEGVELDIAALRSLSASYNNGNGPKPIWATECGAPDTVNPGRQEMARYLVKLMTLMRSAGVERAYWYLAYDYDGYKTGLVRSPSDPLGPYVPSAGFSAYSNLIQQLYGANYVARDNTDARTRMYLFRRGTSDVRVVWSSAGTAQLVLSTNTPLTRIDIMGTSTVLQPTNGLIALTADATPFYLVGAITSVREFGRDIIVADSVRDFSGVQGATNGSWAYGNGFVVPGSAYDLGAVTGMTYISTPYGYAYGNALPFTKIDANGGHPGVRTGYAIVYPVWTVRRWQSNVTATARITGTIVRAAPYGDGTGAQIYVDGTLVYSTLIGGAGAGATTNFSFVTPLQTGAKVDFILTPGPGIDVDFDYVDFRAQVSVPAPNPTTFPMWQEQNFTAAQFIDPSFSDGNAMPARDGVPNLFKYSANLGATASGLNAVPTFGLRAVGSDSYLSLSYRKSTAATDLTFATELNGGNLATGAWIPGGVPLGQPILNADGTQTITIRDVVPISPSAMMRFMRLRVTRP